jgi:superfamily II DNA/RNA helicase
MNSRKKNTMLSLVWMCGALALFLGDSSMTTAFQVGNLNRIPTMSSSSSALMMSSNSPKKASKKPNRFSQTVHNPSPTGDGGGKNKKNKSKSSSPSTKNNNDYSNAMNYNSNGNENYNKNKEKYGENDDNNRSKNSKNNDNESNNDRMWKTKKSIEDLEGRLTARWGTDLSPWTARDAADGDDDEYEEGGDDDEYDDMDWDPEQTIVDSDMPMFRAKPVSDPWQEKSVVKGKPDKSSEKKSSMGGGAFGKSNSDDGMLDKVRRNQQRLKEKREFYDNDDEGYESKKETNANTDKSTRENKIGLNFDNMIAPKPAGGRGTNDVNAYDDNDDDYDYDDDDDDDDNPYPLPKEEEEDEDYDDDDDDEDSYKDSYAGDNQNQDDSRSKQDKPAAPTGFFFRDTRSADDNDNVDSKSSSAQADTTSGKTEREQKRKDSDLRRKMTVPLLDENGKPLLLTIEQAEKDFQESLRASAASLNVNDGDDDDDQAVYTPPETRSWEELGITAPILLENLNRMNCERPLAVQDKSCPPIVSGDDVLVGTYTGSGKTLAFLVPLIQRLLATTSDEDSDDNKSKGLQILIIAPGRELASQIASVARELLQDTNLGVMLAIGGTTFTRNLEQIRKRKPTVIVGTPGRIAELVVGRPGEKTGRLKTGALKALVLDEFDALLEYKPHREPTSAIMDTLKRRHGNYMQTVMCSATASDILESPKLREYLRPGFQQAMADSDDLLVTAGDDSAKGASTRVSRTVIHGVLHVPHRRVALDTLRRVLHTEPVAQQILIFAENSRKVRIIVEKLEIMGIIAAPLHGGFGSEKMDRAEVSKALREGYVGIVVATELAARGLDAPLLTHVINFDLPTDASHYAHRAGRCGRGGRPGVVINFTTGPQERNVPYRFAEKLGVNMYAVEAKNSQLSIVDPDSQQLDQ